MSISAPIHGETTVGELAAGSSSAIRVFTAHGIDYCCGGAKALSEVCEQKQLALDALVAEIEAEELKSAPSDRDWQRESAATVIGHVLSHHHALLDRELPRLGALASKVARVHGVPAQRYLVDLLGEFTELARTLTSHMRDEEKHLFPAMLAHDVHAVRPHLWRMFQEHTDVGSRLERIRALAGNYEIPPNACGSWRALWNGLSELEAAVHDHVHIENNILARRFTVACEND